MYHKSPAGMQEKEEEEENSDLVTSLSFYAQKRDLNKGLALHQYILARGLLKKSIYIGNSLINMYVKCGALAKAQQVFNALPHPDVVSWTALISGYVHLGHGLESLTWFERMQQMDVSPNAFTFSCSLKACGSIGAHEDGRNIHSTIVYRGLLGDNIMLNTSLVDMYARCGALLEAQHVFFELPCLNLVTWNALISGHVQHGYNVEATNIFERMPKQGFEYNVVTYVCILKACRKIEKGKEMHAKIACAGLLGQDKLLDTALVDMYAKCGALSEAQRLFDCSPVKDVVTWSVLIRGYTEHGHDHEALDCFERMIAAGFSLDRVTFACVLRVCGKLEKASKGLEIHVEIIRDDLLCKSNELGTALLDMYVRCGELTKAREVFGELSICDVVSWTALIAGYAQQDYREEALACFGKMQHQGMFADERTFVTLLKACNSEGLVTDGLKLHTQIIECNLFQKVNVQLGNALVDMYARCGAFAKAEKVFDEIPEKNVFSHTALIVGYDYHNQGEKSVQCFDQMQNTCVLPDTVTYSCILKALSSTTSARKGKHIHSLITVQGFLGKEVLGRSLVEMYARCGMLALAQEVFYELHGHTATSWTTLIGGYVQHGNNEEALICFSTMNEKGFSPTGVTFVHVLRACGNITALQKGTEIHEEIIRNGLLEFDTGVGIELVAMYAKCGMFAKAEKIFDALLVQDVVSWTVLISGYTDHGHGEAALWLFENMQQHGLFPNEMTYTCILKTIGCIKASKKGKEIHSKIIGDVYLSRDHALETSLVDMYARCGELALAQRVFNEISSQDVVSSTALILGYVLHGHGEEALYCFDQIQFNGVFPNSMTYACILKACASIGAAEKGILMHADIVRYGFLGNDVALHAALIDMYAKCGALATAQQILFKLPVQDISPWNALLTGYSHTGKHNIVFELFKQMNKNGIQPDMVTFVILLKSCSCSGLIDKSQLYLESMNRCYGVIPKSEHFTCMIALFGRSGLFDKALTMIKQIPCVHYVPLWISLLGGCRKWGNMRVGISAFEHTVIS